MVKIISLAKILLVALAVFSFSESTFAQSVEEVTLTVSGDGTNKTEATNIALRSAVEQAFGVFVSANTTILNDSLVKDEIASVSSGNIKKYEEITSFILPNGSTSVTLKAVVSISMLAKYAESHGSSVEFAGATFGANMKLKELNKANEEKAISNMIDQLKALAPTMFDYKLEMGEVVLSHVENNYEIPVTVQVLQNENTKLSNSILIRTLESLSLTGQERIEYKRIGIKYVEINFGAVAASDGTVLKSFSGADPNHFADTYYFRSNKSKEALRQFILCDFREAVYNFKIIDNTQGISEVEINYGCFYIEGCYDYRGNFSNYNRITRQEDLTSDQSDVKKYIGLIRKSNYPSREYMYNIVPVGSRKGICLSHSYEGGYLLNFILQIPKEDISKYSKFTIERKSTTL